LAKIGSRRELLALSAPTRAQAGNIQYDLYQSPNKKNEFMRLEVRHCASPGSSQGNAPYQSFLRKTPETGLDDRNHSVEANPGRRALTTGLPHPSSRSPVFRVVDGSDYMTLVLTALLTGLMLISPVSATFAQQVVFLVRHADRQDSSPDSPLSKAGKARAEHLALLLQHSGIAAIYTSEWQRTIMTAGPLAATLKIKPVSLPKTNVEMLFNRIRGKHSEDVVLIVGHQKTIPLLLKLFGHQWDFLMERHEYDNLFVLIPSRDQEPTLLRLHY